MIRRLVVGSIVSAEAGEDQGLAREQEQETKQKEDTNITPRKSHE